MKPQRPLYCSIVLLVVAVVSRAEAQASGENRRAAAEALFIEGRRLVAEGKTAEGCAKFAESQALDPGVGTLLNLARCYERIGRTASAWTTYREAASRAQAAGQLQREATARAEADRLASGIPTIELAKPSNPPKEPTLMLDGEPWSHGFPNVPLPVDPGRHELVVRAPGFEPFSTSFEAIPGNTTLVRVPSLRPLPKAPVVPPPRDAGEPWRMTHTFAVANIALAVAATTVGTVLALEARDTYSEAQDNHCPGGGDQCDERGLELREEAFDQARAATIAFGIAGAAAVGAAVLWFTRRAPDRFPWQSKTTSVQLGTTPKLEVTW